MTAFLALLKLVPLKDWLYIGAGLALTVGLLAYNHHERSIGREQAAAEIVTYKSQLDLAQAANAQMDATIAALKQSVADCEKGRRADSEAMDKAKQAYTAQLEQFKASDAKVHAQTAQRLATTCREIANQPTCVTADRHQVGGAP